MKKFRKWLWVLTHWGNNLCFSSLIFLHGFLKQISGWLQTLEVLSIFKWLLVTSYDDKYFATRPHQRVYFCNKTCFEIIINLLTLSSVLLSFNFHSINKKRNFMEFLTMWWEPNGAHVHSKYPKRGKRKHFSF